MELEKEYYSRTEVADMTGLTRQSVANYIASGILKTAGNARGSSGITAVSLRRFLERRDAIDTIDKEIDRYIGLRNEVLANAKRAYEEALETREGIDNLIQMRKELPLFNCLLGYTWLALMNQPVKYCDLYRDAVVAMVDGVPFEKIASRYDTSSQHVRDAMKKVISEAAHLQCYRNVVAENEELKQQIARLEEANHVADCELSALRERDKRSADAAHADLDRVGVLYGELFEVLRPMSVRARNSLITTDMEKVVDLVKKTKTELLDIRGFGKSCLMEIVDLLYELGLKLGMSAEEIHDYAQGKPIV